jgi:hypothetical protein
MPKAAAPIFPFSDAWLPVLPVLPLVLFSIILSWLIDPAVQLGFLEIKPEHFISRPQREYIHLGDMLTYYSLAGFHSLLCLVVIAVFVHWMRRLQVRCLLRGVIFLGAILLLIVLIGIFFYREADRQVLVQLGFKATCRLVEAAALPTQLTSPGCFVPGVSRLTWLAWLPTFSGMGAVAFAASFAYASACDMPLFTGSGDRNSPAWREALAMRVTALQRSVYLLSAVLVSSTITITDFAHLPVGLLTSKDGDFAVAAAVSKYATGLSTFWGALFSMTLIATFAAPAFRLFTEAYGEDGAARDSTDLRQWLDQNVFQSVKRQFATVLSLLAPLLVGPLSSLLSSFSRF